MARALWSPIPLALSDPLSVVPIGPTDVEFIIYDGLAGFNFSVDRREGSISIVGGSVPDGTYWAYYQYKVLPVTMIQIGFDGNNVRFVEDLDGFAPHFTSIQQALGSRTDGSLPLFLVSVDPDPIGDGSQPHEPVIPSTGEVGFQDIRPFKPMASFGVASNQAGSNYIAVADGITSQDTSVGTGIKSGHIQNRAVLGDHLADGILESRHFQGGVLPTSVFPNGFIQPVHFSPESVVESAIAPGAVTSLKIGIGAILSLSDPVKNLDTFLIIIFSSKILPLHFSQVISSASFKVLAFIFC